MRHFPTARSSTSATGTPTAARRWRPRGSSPATRLAEYLDEQGVAYTPFDSLDDVLGRPQLIGRSARTVSTSCSRLGARTRIQTPGLRSDATKN